jgi:hypothetical protein
MLRLRLQRVFRGQLLLQEMLQEMLQRVNGQAAALN